MSEEVKPSLGEIMRRLDDLTMEVKQMNLNVSQTYLRKDVYESDSERFSQAMEHITDRLEKMESRSEWVVRTVGGLMIATIVGASVYVGQIIGF
jgi:tetrahydromethanopterin S-methyltransferase subunit G